MKVVVIAKAPFDCTTYENVTNISLSGGDYVLTLSNGTTVSYAKGNYIVKICE